MELVPRQLYDRLGIRKVLLSYVIQENAQPDPVEAQGTNRVNGLFNTTTVE